MVPGFYVGPGGGRDGSASSFQADSREEDIPGEELGIVDDLNPDRLQEGEAARKEVK